MAVAAASFSTVMDFISLGDKFPIPEVKIVDCKSADPIFIFGISPCMGIPSTIQMGSVLPFNELIPRIWILASCPGRPVLIMFKPATVLLKASSTEVSPFPSISLAVIVFVLPVKRSRLTLWYPVTTTSSISLRSSFRIMLITVLPFTFTTWSIYPM